MDAPAACRHCAQPLASLAEGAFCCGGCRTAHEVIAACGLETFYRLRRGEAGPPAAVSFSLEARWMDGEAFAARHVHRLDEQRSIVRWRVEGIHCSACVWLLEHLPRLGQGISAARVDLADDALTVVFDPQRCPPSRQVELAASLGYRLRPRSASPGDGRDARRREVLRLIVSLASATGAMHVAMNLLAGGLSGDLDASSRQLFAWLVVPIAAPALTYGAWPFWRGAIAALRLRRITLDVTTVAVLVVAIAASLVNLGSGGDLYLDAAAMFVALLLAGRAVASAVRRGAMRRLAGFGSLLPAHAVRLEVDGREQAVAMESLMPGDRIAVIADGIVPCDGVAEHGGRVSLAVLTGEPHSVAVQPGDALWAGSVNRGERLTLRATACAAETRVGALLERARATASVEGQRAGRIAGWFAGLILLAALATGGLWLMLDPTRALDQTVGMVLALCPCALGLGVPLVHAVTTARAARRGLVVREAWALETLAGASDIVFDKTGTLTVGEPDLMHWELLDGTIAPWLLAAEERSRHPVAVAVAQRLRQTGITAVELAADSWREEPGRGVVVATPRGELRIGTPIHAGLPDWVVAPGVAPLAATLAERPVLRAAVGDALKPGAVDLVRGLVARGTRVHLLSGDAEAVVAEIGAELGLPGERCRGAVLPEGKRAYVAELVRAGATVAMIGDGLNDAAALATAQIGIGVRGGLAACLERCAVIATGGGIAELKALFRGARAMRGNLRACLTVALLYNLAAAGLVLAGAWGPLICAVAMPASSLTVLALAMLGRAFR